jgi:PKD repeat protein
MKMSDDSGNLSIDFLVGFTIFILAFIWVVSMIPGLLINLQGYTIDSDAVAYRTGVILAEDPGEPALPSFPWETQSKIDVVRFGLAISKNTPNILSRDKVDKFFCSSVFSYPDDYQQRIIFGDYPYRFNITLIEVGTNKTPLSVGDVMSGNYGTIRRLVKIKEPTTAMINASNLTYMNKYHFINGDNETQHEFSILINNTELTKDKVRDPIYQIDPAREKITINITDLNSTLYSGRETCFDINLTKIYAKDPAFVKIQLFTEPVIDGVQYHDINTEGMYAALPSIKHNISVALDPGFIPWSNYPQVYLNLTFKLVKNTTACDPSNPLYNFTGSQFLNNSLTSAFDYNYDSESVTQPQLRDAVLEVNTGSGYRTETVLSTIPLVANFKYEILSGSPTFTVKFTDLSTGSPVDWEWDFTNDGTVDSTLNNPSNSYGTSGIKTVKLTVKDAFGNTSSTTGTVDLSAPVAGFNGIPVLGNSPLNVQFTDTSTGGAPSSWKWEYNKTSGGGWTQFNTTQNPLNTFTVGTYDIRLTANNTFGPNTSIKYSYITVIPPVPPTFVSAATNTAGNVITITFNKAMANPAGKNGQFGYRINGGALQTFSAAALNADTTKIDLTTSGIAIAGGNTVTVSYTAGTVLAADNGVLATFTNQPVTNNMPTYTIVTRNTVGTTTWTVPAGVTSVEYLVVAGGGGGGNSPDRTGGGGGAGGVQSSTTYPVTAGASLTVIVGAGGNANTNGGNSQFDTITAIGGGRGGQLTTGAAIGGSGGGAYHNPADSGKAGTAGQGSAGGNGYDSGSRKFGAGGGGGGGWQNLDGGAESAGAGGTGGGGAGGKNGGAGTAGAANTGGGGGGGSSVGGSAGAAGGRGGSGIVIIKYLNP